MAEHDDFDPPVPPRILRQSLAEALPEPDWPQPDWPQNVTAASFPSTFPSAPPPPPPPAPPAEERPSPQSRAKAFEAMLRASPPLRVETTPAAATDQAEVRPKTREILFRGSIYVFKPIGLDCDDRRPGLLERWRADVHVTEGTGFNLIVSEFREGRFTPWAFDGIFFNDFLQAAIVGVVSGSFKANWQREQWEHERSRRKLMLFIMPLVALISLLTGIVLGLH